MKVKAIALLLALAILFSGCIQEQPAQGEETIKIGAILPMTGTVAYLGQFESEGISLAMEKVNEEGINGKKLEIAYEDTGGDTKQGVSAYQKLTQVEGINVLLTTESGTTLAIAPLAEEDKAIVFSVAGASSKISDAGDFIFRHNLLPDKEAEYLADVMFNDFGHSKIGMIVVNSDSGETYASNLKKAFEEKGGEVVIIEKYEKGAKDYQTQLTKVKAAEPDAVFLFGHAQETGLLLKQAEELGINIPWFGSFAAEEDSLIENAGDSANGLIYTNFFDANSKDPVFRAFAEKYQQRYGYAPGSFAALAYDNVMILAQVLKECGSPYDTVCIKDKLYKIKDFSGVTGAITFNENGDTEKEIMLKTVKNGEFVLYEGD